MDPTFESVTTRLGPRALHELAAAYENAVQSLRVGEVARIPNRRVRQVMVDAMLAQGQRGGFEASRLSEVAAAAARAAILPPFAHTRADTV